MTRIAIIDYGMGNLASVAKALQHVAPKAHVHISSNPTQIRNADRLVLPGQGAMRDCMGNLQRSGLHEVVLEQANHKPLLGVCVGEQMLFEFSEEGGGVPGLGLFRGQVRRFSADMPDKSATDGVPQCLKVPHMGWNRVRQVPQATLSGQGSHPLWAGIADQSYFYFVHSYYVAPDERDTDLIAGETIYGIPFTCAVARANIFATQFHPEKSAAAGLRLYENFVTWNP